MVDHAEPKTRRNKWLIFLFAIFIPFYFPYILIKLYNTHDFSEDEPKHQNFKWSSKSIAYLVVIILSFVLSMVLLFLDITMHVTVHSATLNMNPSQMGPYMGLFIVLLIITGILAIIGLILEISMISELTSTHYFDDNIMKHKPSNDDSFILWFIVCLIFSPALLYLEYKISEVYANHVF